MAGTPQHQMPGSLSSNPTISLKKANNHNFVDKTSYMPSMLQDEIL